MRDKLSFFYGGEKYRKNWSAIFGKHTRKKSLGQFFTKSRTVQNIFSQLIQNERGPVVEPSCGEGDLISAIDDRRKVFAFEYDKNVINASTNDVIYGCFFDEFPKVKIIPTTIVSNPPYVSITEYSGFMSDGMKEFVANSGYKGKYNISFLFMHMCASILSDDGEMIFIVPKDFTYATSAFPLRTYLMESGHFTHWIDCNEKKLFADACVESLVIFRWVKSPSTLSVQVSNVDSLSFVPKTELYFGEENILLFLEKEVVGKVGKSTIGDFFNIYVGSVSGCDEVFKIKDDRFSKLLVDMVSGNNLIDKFLNTNVFKNFEDMPEDVQAYLTKHKNKLIQRYSVKHSKDTEDSWWRWSFLRNVKYSFGIDRSPRIYVSAKTRKQIFSVGESGLGFSGGVYALIPKISVDLKLVANFLNGGFFRSILEGSGCVVNNKFSITPRAILSLPFNYNLCKEII